MWYQSKVGVFCVYVSVCKSVHMCAHTHMEARGSFLDHSSIYLLRQGLLLNMDLSDLAILVRQQDARISISASDCKFLKKENQQTKTITHQYT